MQLWLIEYKCFWKCVWIHRCSLPLFIFSVSQEKDTSCPVGSRDFYFILERVQNNLKQDDFKWVLFWGGESSLCTPHPPIPGWVYCLGYSLFCMPCLPSSRFMLDPTVKFSSSLDSGCGCYKCAFSILFGSFQGHVHLLWLRKPSPRKKGFTWRKAD